MANIFGKGEGEGEGEGFDQVRSTNQMMFPVYAFLLFMLQTSSEFCSAIDSITPTRYLDDSETIVSNNSIFRLGFFNPPNSKNRYVGIWYNHPSVMEVVWVANRNNPLTDSNGMLKLSVDGNLQVSNARNETLWSSNITHSTSRFSVAELQDSGNLIVRGFPSATARENGTILWQSFQHPSDSVIPNMRFVLTKDSELRKVLQAWRSPADPSDGRFSVGTNSLGIFQIIIYDGDRPYWRSGPWNGNIFMGTRYHNTGYGNIMINTGSFAQEEIGGMLSLVFTGANETLLPHYVINYQGILAQRWWDDSKKNWEISWHAPENECDTYGKCGEFGNCNVKNRPMCSCLKGFKPKNEEQWRRGDWTSGCIRRKQLQCRVQGGKNDGFLRLQKMKVPDNGEWTVGLNPSQCRSTCLANCSCLAYMHDTGIGCMRWSGNLIDIEDLSPGGVDLYIRLEHSELGNAKRHIAIIAVSVISATAVVAIIMWVLWNRRIQPKVKHPSNKYDITKSPTAKKDEKKRTDLNAFRDKRQVLIDELQVLKLEDLIKATDGFSESTLLGKGGFGQVYKGNLENGQAVAVKRLSRASGQGVDEFMNEAELISKLQHRNLVKLLGCCAEGEEKMLIYEYMPNKSLDSFLFDPQRHELSQWEKRYNIIQGICRGLLYLHRDSRLRIIHRDLKASNILLDEDLNPKISDFGMARIFGGNQDQASTERVVGTYGYMSPEYAMEGHFSEKSDVFSFGVLLLEIVSGKKNSRFWYHEDFSSLLGYAWKLWNEKNISLLIDPSISSPNFQDEIPKCIQVGLLCVQEFARDRPNISEVMSMFVRDILDLPIPKQPGFIQRQIPTDTGSSHISEETSTANHVTISTLIPR